MILKHDKYTVEVIFWRSHSDLFQYIGMLIVAWASSQQAFGFFPLALPTSPSNKKSSLLLST